MSFWLHCNLCCWQQPQHTVTSSASGSRASAADSQRPGRFVLTSCGHVFCDNCVSAGLTTSCSVCGRQQVKTTAIDANLSADLQKLFQPPVDTLRTLSRALDFQTRQGVNLDRVLRKQLETAAKAVRAMQEKVTHLAKELQMAQDENQQLKDAMAKLKRKAAAQQKTNAFRMMPVPKPYAETIQPLAESPSESVHETSLFCLKTPALLKNTETEDIRRAISGMNGGQEKNIRRKLPF